MAFEVREDLRAHRIHVTLTGFATLDDVERFDEALQRAITRLPAHRGPHQLLYDVSGAKIQSQEVVQALRSLALGSPRTSAFALVNASALAGRQLARIFEGIPVEICRDLPDALRFLDERAGS